MATTRKTLTNERGLRATAAATALIWVVAACGPSKPPSTEKASEQQPNQTATSTISAMDLFPVKLGNRWTYEMEVNQTDANQNVVAVGVRIWEIAKVLEGDGWKVALVKEYTDKQELVNTYKVKVTKDLIAFKTVVLKGKTFAIDPPLPICKWPMTQGEQMAWNGTGLSDDPRLKLKTTITFQGETEVDTAEGREKAYRVDIVTEPADGSGTPASRSTYWFKPGIGVVRNVDVQLQRNFVRKTILRLKGATVQ